jgi:hypothetical protein
MRDLLVADLSVMDVHFQLWMVLVTAILLIWFAFFGQHVLLAGIGPLKLSIFLSATRLGGHVQNVVLADRPRRASVTPLSLRY